MEKLEEMRRNFEQEGLSLQIRGLDTHQLLSEHALAARRRGLARIRRITVIGASALVEHLAEQFTSMGATGYTITECRGAGREKVAQDSTLRDRQVRIEVLVDPPAAEQLIDYLRAEVISAFDVTASVETVKEVRADHFRQHEFERENTVTAHRQCNTSEPIGINYVLHCLPGELNAKTIAFDHLRALLKPGGVIFGSTLRGEGVQRGILDRRLMALFSRKRIFSNAGDSLGDLKRLLAERFARSEVCVEGCAALFWARTAV